MLSCKDLGGVCVCVWGVCVVGVGVAVAVCVWGGVGVNFSARILGADPFSRIF